MSCAVTRSLLPGLPHAPVEDGRDPELAADPAHVVVLAAKSEGGRARRDAESRDARERRDDLFRHPVAEVLALRARAVTLRKGSTAIEGSAERAPDPTARPSAPDSGEEGRDSAALGDPQREDEIARGAEAVVRTLSRGSGA